MKIECIRENLEKAVSLAERVTGKKLPLAVLGKVLLEIKDKSLFVRATNLDLGIEIKVSAKVNGSGKVAVSGALLSSHLFNLPNGSSVTLESIDNNLLISTSSSSALITTFSTEDFPELPKISTKDPHSGSFSIEARDFVTGLRSVSYSASPSDLKPELGSVFIHTEDKYLIFTATDSFRLAEKKVDIPKVSESGALSGGILLPLRNASEIIRVYSDVNSKLEINYSKNQISLDSGEFHMTSRLVEGSFPAYSHLIPKSFTTQAVLLKEDLASSLKLASVFADRFNQLSFKIIPEDTLFELRARNQETGESTVKTDATIEGAALDVALNGRYLIDCFQSIPQDSVSLGFNGKDKAVLIRPVGDHSFSYLLMPLHQ